ncbi:MAG: cytochrome c oxidase assembly protein [Alphaproteobacteria bacterium]
MRLAAPAAMLVLTAAPAAAHGIVPIQPDALWRVWSFDPLVVVPLLIAHWAYGGGTLRLWARAGRGRGVGRRHVLSFLLGETVLVVALVSPLDQLGGTLLSAHMAQHGLLVAVAPPLLLMGLPGAAFAWALPAGWSKGGLIEAWRPVARLGRVLSHPMPAAVLHGLALWVWHAPWLFDAALEHEWVHRLEHASFFGTALLFWRAILGARSGHRIGPALGASFATLMHGGLLGALITMAPYPLYGWYRGRTELWGMTPLADQQLAGLLMWVPMGVVYFGACLFLASRLLASGERRHPRTARAGAVPLEKAGSEPSSHVAITL